MKRRIRSFLPIIVVAFLFVLTGVHAAYAAVAVDNVSTGSTSGTTITISHATSGSDRLMLVGVSLNNGNYETVTGVTYNDVHLTYVGEAHEDDDGRIEIWKLVAPNTGTANVVVTFSADLIYQGIAGVTTFTGVDQTAPHGPFAPANDTSSTAKVNLNSATDELVFGVVAAETPSGLTVGPNQTGRWNIVAGSGRTEGAGSTEPGAAIVEMSWTLGSSDHWAIGAVSIKPSGTSSSVTATITSPTSGSTYATDTDTVTLAGSASGGVGIVEVRWSNDRGGSGVCSGTTNWTTGSISLASGANVITITAEDSVGTTGSDVLTVNYDPTDGEAPLVWITSPTSGSTYSTNSASITLSGTASDNVGVTQVTWSNSAGGSGTCSGMDSWSSGSIALAEGSNVITVTARDAAGNTSTDVITVTYTPDSPPPEPPPDPEPDPTPGKGDTEIYTGYDGASGVEPNVLLLLDTSSSMTGRVPTDVDPTGYNSGTTYALYDASDDEWLTNTLYVYDLDGDSDQKMYYLTPDNFPCLDIRSMIQTNGFWSGHIVLTSEWTSSSWKSLEPADIDYCIPSDWPSGTPYPPYTYPLSVRVGNYINYIYTGGGSTLRRKIEIAIEVLAKIVEGTFGVRFGYMIYNPCVGDPRDMDNEYIYNNYGFWPKRQNEGGSILFPVQDMTSGPTGTRQQLIDIINTTDTASGTSQSESHFEAHRYFKENALPNGGPYFDTGAYRNEDTPIQHWCQKNYVIHITDGATSDEDNNRILSEEIGDIDGDGREPPYPDYDCIDAGDEEVGWRDFTDDIAQYMYTHDYSSLPGVQNVMNYTIGFDVNLPILQQAADQGGGKYYYCENTRDLTIAFHRIVGEIIQEDSSYTAPVIPVNYMEKTSSRNEIYIALFRPSTENFWPGNIKKFGIATADDPVLGVSEGDLVDMFGNPILDPDNQILESAVSFWGPWAGGGDGNNVTEGGVGEVLQNMNLSNRIVYTYLAGKTNRPLSHPSNAFATTNGNLTPQRLGFLAGETTKRDELIRFVSGYDVYDDDQDGQTTDPRTWMLGAFIHSRPAVISYNQDTTVIFAGANDGMLHAFWDGNPALHQGGSELWAYIPPSLLSGLKNLSEDHLVPAFYVDGSPKVYLNDVNHDGRISEVDGDQAILICGLRRGGRHYFALDVTDPENPEVPIGWANWGVWDSDTVWRATGMIGPEMTTESGDKALATYPYAETGQSWSTPFITTINDSGTQRAVALITAGYDKNQDGATPGADTMGRGVYAVDVLNGQPVWAYTYDGGLHPDMTFSIPSAVTAVDTTGSGVADRLYVGDTGGRLWRFDIGASNPASWTGRILFNADPAGTAYRKFFYPPDVTQEYGFEMLFIGSGNRAHPLEKTTTDYLYAIKDRNPVSVLTAGDLVNVTDGKLMSGTEEEKATIKANLESKDGWYIQLENTGEKCLAPALVFAGVAYYTTFEPDATVPIDPCEAVASLGTARLYALDYANGNAVYNFDTSSADLGKTDRSLIVGGSIASGVVIGLIEGVHIGKLGVDGSIPTVEVRTASGLFTTYWRMMD